MLSDDDVIRCPVALRNPFQVESLPFLSRVHRAAFRKRRRLSKRFVGKPAKRLFTFLTRRGVSGEGTFSIEVDGRQRQMRFNASNTQFGALYLPQSLPVYEPETSALLDLLVGDNDVFFDVGANWGWYSLLLASRPGFTGSVHAFEPFPTTFLDLSSVVEQAGLSQRIHCHDVALADKAGEISMGFSDGIQSGLARLGESGGTIVRMVRLDDMSLPSPAVIKIDAEDHELEVLQGAEATIAAARPLIVFENWLHRDNPDLTLAPIRFLAERGYRFFYPGWIAGDRDCVVQDLALPPILTLVPMLTAQRFQLPSQLNIVAVPHCRIDAFRGRFA
ncbi:FkbM family methyltransferase [Magnetospirillum sulfuroxidans]|uniref:FkbM family methyltransferase n=1 Tax=Magnetospirillum sulfuroxidans TaxID=611300 RepID=A0ABS5IDN2_9PROT|nr:FkbM family methyltransferase [Magnetospirillum sulfuroxidans]MBR9972510.1 FkbM family methyltransferase [Magnetospirillum sulfuroxidans]